MMIQGSQCDEYFLHDLSLVFESVSVTKNSKETRLQASGIVWEHSMAFDAVSENFDVLVHENQSIAILKYQYRQYFY